MWIAVVIAMFASLIGYQSILAQATDPTPHDAQIAQSLADNMTSYRFAVVAFANANPAFVGTATDAQLAGPAPTYFPTGYVAPSPPMWSNVIQADGTIAIYATRLPASSLMGPLNLLSMQSPLVGQISAPPATVTTTTTTVLKNAAANPNAPGQFLGQTSTVATTTSPATFIGANVPTATNTAAPTPVSVPLSLPALLNQSPVWFAHRG
jgi:hypothetical protein